MANPTLNFKTIFKFQRHRPPSFEQDRFKFLQLNPPMMNSASFGERSMSAVSLFRDASFGRTQTLKTNRFKSLFLDESSADITFIVGPENCSTPEKIPAHKILLSSYSPVFRTMFFGSLPERNDIRIVDVSADAFKEFIEYFYHDEVDLTRFKCAAEVMYLAHKYEVKEYSIALAPFLMATDPVACLELVAKSELPELHEICKQTIIDDHTEFFESKSFVQHDCDVLKMILGWNEVKVYGEEIFMACFRWAENAWRQQQQEHQAVAKSEPTPADIRTKMDDFFDLIEFSSMKSSALVTKLVEFADFFTQSDLVGIHKILANKHLASLDNVTGIVCYLMAKRQDFTIKKIESITFESSKDLIFIDYFWSLQPIPHTMILSKKSSTGSEIVSMRKRCGWNFHSSANDDAIKIQANTKYEIQLIFSSSTAERKLWVQFAYTSNVCDLGNDEKLKIEGHSIISGLQFIA